MGIPRLRISQTVYLTIRISRSWLPPTELTESSNENTNCVDAGLICSNESEFDDAVTVQFNRFELNDLIKNFNLSIISLTKQLMKAVNRFEACF